MVLIVLVAALGAVIFFLARPRPSPGAAEVLAADAGPLDARRGDVVSIVGRGDDYDDLIFTVGEVTAYSSGGDRWREVGGDYRGQRVFMEAWDDDGIRVSITKPSGAVAWHDVGLGEDDLVRLDESQAIGSPMEAAGVTWRFAGSGEITAEADGEREGFYAWSFDEDGGDRELTIEKWEGEPFDAVISERVDAGDVTVLRGEPRL